MNAFLHILILDHMVSIFLTNINTPLTEALAHSTSSLQATNASRHCTCSVLMSLITAALDLSSSPISFSCRDLSFCKPINLFLMAH